MVPAMPVNIEVAEVRKRIYSGCCLLLEIHVTHISDSQMIVFGGKWYMSSYVTFKEREGSVRCSASVFAVVHAPVCKLERDGQEVVSQQRSWTAAGGSAQRAGAAKAESCARAQWYQITTTVSL